MDGTVEVRRGIGCCRFEVSCEVRRFTSLDRTRWLVLDSIPDFSDRVLRTVRYYYVLSV